MRISVFGLMAALMLTMAPAASAVNEVPWTGRTCEVAVIGTAPVKDVEVSGIAADGGDTYPGLKVTEPLASKAVSATVKDRYLRSRLQKARSDYSPDLSSTTAGFYFPCAHLRDNTTVSWTEADGHRMTVSLGDRTSLFRKDSSGNYAYHPGEASQPWPQKTCELAITATAPVTDVFVESDVFTHAGMVTDVPIATLTGSPDRKFYKLYHRRWKSVEEFHTRLWVGRTAGWLIPCHLAGEVGPTAVHWRDAAGESHVYYPLHDTGLPGVKDTFGNFAYQIG